MYAATNSVDSELYVCLCFIVRDILLRVEESPALSHSFVTSLVNGKPDYSEKH